MFAKRKRQPQRTKGDDDGKQDGEHDQRGGEAAGGREPHGAHADIVHGGDAAAHDDAAPGEAERAHDRAADKVQSDGAGEDRSQQREQHGGPVESNRDGKLECFHADVVHGQDADSHGEGAAREPGNPRKCAGGHHASREIQADIGREYRDEDREQNQMVVDGAGEHHGRTAWPVWDAASRQRAFLRSPGAIRERAQQQWDNRVEPHA